MRRRGNIGCKLVAQMLVKAGFNHIITLDLHSKESQGFFDCAIDNLRASPFLIQYIQEFVSKNILIIMYLFFITTYIGKTEASDARGCIVAKLLAQMLVRSGFQQIITVDLHQAELQGYFDCPVDNLRASPFLNKYVVQSVSGVNLCVKKLT